MRAPATLEPTRHWHSRADRFLAATRRAVIPLAVVLGIAAGQIANEAHSRYAMLPTVAFFFILGGWCSLNFARCREAHCLITGIGFDALAVTASVGIIFGRTWYGPLSLMIVPILVGGFVFEATWARRRGSRAMGRAV